MFRAYLNGVSVATLSKIELHFGRRVLFDGLNLNVEAGERIGLIGENGSGKTTLFKILTGQIAPDSGSVSIAKDTTLGHLTQDPRFEASNTVIDEAELAFAPLHALSHRLREIEHEMAGLSGEALEKVLREYQQTQHEFELAGGYAWRHRLEATLLGVGLERNAWEQNVATLSGGQRSRLALAKLLISQPDLLLLDEPTNHLDLEAIEWLERYLLAFRGAVVLISHDRYLLDRLATRIVWLTQARLRSYPGNYSAFIAQRDLQELTQQRAYEQQQADIEKQKEFIRRFGAGQRSREAKGREKRLNRLLDSDALVQEVQASKKIRLSLGTEQRAGDQVLSVRDLSKAYDSNSLWSGVSFDVRRGERLGLIGPNGSGKTTLLEALLGRVGIDAGQVRWGANLHIGYYDQRLDDFDGELTVLETARLDSDAAEQQVRDVLATMLFRGDDVNKRVGLLSGGERARLRLSQLLLERPNVLLLDEPTNHLDIPSREALESALAAFEGTILCVSHDRYFLEKIIKRLLVLEPPRVIDFSGRYSQWSAKSGAEKEPEEASPAPRPRPQAAAQRAVSPSKDNPYARPFGRLTLEQLEQQITDTEIALAECRQSFADPQSFKDASRPKTLQAEYEALSRKLDALEAEYYRREE